MRFSMVTGSVIFALLLLVGCGPPPAIPVFPAGTGRTADAPLDAAKWKVLQGDFKVVGGKYLEATNGAVIFTEEFEAVRFSATVEHLAGSKDPYISFGWFTTLFHGGTERYLDGSSDWENYSLEFNFAGKATLWRGNKGSWAHIHWPGYATVAALRPDKNEIEIESKGGTHKLSINGQVVQVQQDAKHTKGAVSFWLADDGGSYRFSNISVTPL
jgi:hypothetical protein